MTSTNPFSCDAATNLKPKEISAIYSEDFNYSRFICSKKNIFLIGDRGTGKSMTLRYNSINVQFENNQHIPTDKIINVYIPCNSMLSYSREHELLEEVEASIISEHFLAASIIFYISDALKCIFPVLGDIDHKDFVESLNYKLGIKILLKENFYDSLKMYIQNAISTTKSNILSSITSGRKAKIFDNIFSFFNHVVPFIDHVLSIPTLSGGHFSLLIDDAQYLNIHQITKINTWIAHRDHSNFSFKVATTKVDRPTYRTEAGGCISEGHDFTLIDMENPYQNKRSNFGKLARDIVVKRLENHFGLKIKPENFFPENEQFAKDISEFTSEARALAQKKYPHGPSKAIDDYVYKYTRAMYFRSRSKKSNRPPYSGFETIVQMSTGVIRNLLEPCFWMYDDALSEARTIEDDAKIIDHIPSSIQTKIILNQSLKKWDWLLQGLDKFDRNCSTNQARHVYNLIDQICILFRSRLFDDISEPRAVMFSISDTSFEHYQYVLELIEIARRSQVIYERLGNSKDEGKSEIYYIPNKILLPSRGLDPVGQHARVSIMSRYLYEASVFGKKIPHHSRGYDGLSLLDIK